MESETLDKSGKPVAADRSALVERVKTDIEMFLGDWLDASYGPYDQLAKLSVSAVEAAGWGPRAEPVAPPEPLYRKCPDCPGDGTSCLTCDGEGYVPVVPPEPLSAGEIAAMARQVFESEWPDVDYDEHACAHCEENRICSVLAELPARFAVPVEGA